MSKNEFKIKNALNLEGFSLVKNYLTENEEIQLVKNINKQKWVIDYQRRLQYYNYRNELFEPYDLIPIPEKIPNFLEELIDRMVADKIIILKPDQIIINEYLPGEGLKPHMDRKDYYQNTIVGISLLSGITMEFTKNNPFDKKKVYLPRRSLYILKNDARYVWKHGIPPRKSDIINNEIIPRGTRISITFRNVVKDKIKYNNIVYPARHPSELIE